MIARILSLGVSIWLVGCSVVPSSMIKSDTLSYDDIIEDTTDKLLILNVLRARDKAPLHFADISNIHESIQGNATLEGKKYFGDFGAVVRNGVTAGATFQLVPSFDVVPLTSKEFVTGLASPLDPKIVKHWLDRGLDGRIVWLLFVSTVEITDPKTNTTIIIKNSPRKAADEIKVRAEKAEWYASEADKDYKCDSKSGFEQFLTMLNTVKVFRANTYTERRLLADDLKPQFDNADYLTALANLDPTRVAFVIECKSSADAGSPQGKEKTVEYAATGNSTCKPTYKLYATSDDPKVAFCFYSDGAEAHPVATSAGSTSNKDVCTKSVVEPQIPQISKKPTPTQKEGEGQRAEITPSLKRVENVTALCAVFNNFLEKKPRDDLQVKATIRSVGQMIQFLGDVLYFQDELRKIRLRSPHSPVTFGYCEDAPEPGCNDVLFDLVGDQCNSRFTVTYRDGQYSVPNFDAPRVASSCESDIQRRTARGKDNNPIKNLVLGKDHTLEVLSVLHDLVDLNRSGADLKATPFVQVLP